MGSWLSKLWNESFGPIERRIIILGLDAAGKTSILYKMHLGECINTVPTLGFNVEHLKIGKVSCTTWDVGGQSKIRALWSHYFQGTDGIVFVVDSSDVDRMGDEKNTDEGTARFEMDQLMRHDELRNAALLVLANKQDLPNALTVPEIAKRLGLNQLKNRKWFIQASVVPTGVGLHEGFNWLAKTVSQQQ